MSIISRTTEVTVYPKGEPIFSEMATRIRVEDEAAGEFVEIVQEYGQDGKRSIRLDAKEWEYIKQIVDRMFLDIEKHRTP
jgi:hypothetical protein